MHRSLRRPVFCLVLLSIMNLPLLAQDPSTPVEPEARIEALIDELLALLDALPDERREAMGRLLERRLVSPKPSASTSRTATLPGSALEAPALEAPALEAPALEAPPAEAPSVQASAPREPRPVTPAAPPEPRPVTTVAALPVVGTEPDPPRPALSCELGFAAR